MKVWGEKRPLVSESTVNRLEVLDQFEGAKLTRKHSADILELSERQITRIRERYSKGGALALEHKSKGKAPPNKTSAETIKKLTELLQGKYYGFNVTHACEQINQNDGIEVKYDILKNLSRKLGLTKTKVRHRKVRKQRKRYATEGFMLQMDGSEHRWFGGKVSTLISAIDDATSEVFYGEFVENENLVGVLAVIKKIVELRGIPRVLYVDRARNFGWLGGEEESQFNRICSELGIKVIYANSPQGKGRVERMWGTLQDRLCSEFRLHKIDSMELATKYFNERFIRDTWSPKFTVLAKNETLSWMPTPTAEAIKEIFCYKYTRKIKNDHTVHWQNEIYLIQSSLEVSLVGRYADIRIYDNGLMKVFYGGRELVMEVAKNRSWSQLRQSPKTWSRTKVEGASLYK
jgi:transposase